MDIPVKPSSVIPASRGKALDPMAALGLAEKPGKEIDRMKKDAVSKAAPTTTALTRKGGKIEEPPVAPPKPVEIKPEAAKPAEVKPVPAAAPVAKIKIGDKEFTPEELQAHVAELEKKATTPPVAAPVAPKPPEQVTAEQKTAQEAHTKFLDEMVKGVNLANDGIALTEDQLDGILSGGAFAVKSMQDILTRQSAATELRTRQWVEEQLNPILEDISKAINPMQQATAKQQQEQWIATVETAHPDLKGKADLIESVARALRKNFPAETGKMTAEDFNNEVAFHVREGIKKFGGTPATAVPVVEVKPVVESPKPPTGQVPGAQNAPTAVNAQRSMAAAVAAM
jgi:hypothetical protein